MNYRVACLMIAVLGIAADPRALASSAPERHATGGLEIVVDGAPVPRFAHGGRWYVEALKGKEYAIRLQNPYPVRVAVALSVDGLNTIDARETTAAGARKWVLDPYQTVTISGWQVSQSEARRFEFTTEARSYGSALGKTANLGMISAVFFKERASTITSRTRSGGADRDQPLPSPMPARAEPPASAAAGTQAPEAAEAKADAEYAATGIGRRTDHAVTQVWLDLEDTPAQTVNVRYEFRAQLVKLGILPDSSTVDPLQRRERARGFDSGFSPEPPDHR